MRDQEEKEVSGRGDCQGGKTVAADGGQQPTGGCVGQSAAQFVNAITVDLPSPNDESNRRCGGLRSFSMLAIQNTE